MNEINKKHGLLNALSHSLNYISIEVKELDGSKLYAITDPCLNLCSNVHQYQMIQLLCNERFINSDSKLGTIALTTISSSKPLTKEVIELASKKNNIKLHNTLFFIDIINSSPRIYKFTKEAQDIFDKIHIMYVDILADDFLYKLDPNLAYFSFFLIFSICL